MDIRTYGWMDGQVDVDNVGFVQYGRVPKSDEEAEPNDHKDIAVSLHIRYGSGTHSNSGTLTTMRTWVQVQVQVQV